MRANEGCGAFSPDTSQSRERHRGSWESEVLRKGIQGFRCLGLSVGRLPVLIASLLVVILCSLPQHG